MAGRTLAPNFTTNISNIVWTVAVAFVSFVIGAYFLSGMTGAAREKKERFFSTANKFWLRSFFAILTIVIVSGIIWAISFYGASFIGKKIGLDIVKAVVVFVSIYIIGLIGFLIFFTYSSFFVVLKEAKFQNAIRESFSLTKREYLKTLLINLVFFAWFFALDKIKGNVGDILIFGVLLPYFVAVLTRFVEAVDLKKSEK